jgi:Fe-S-cluster containining protein
MIMTEVNSPSENLDQYVSCDELEPCEDADHCIRGCTGDCCKAYDVLCSIHDIKRIHECIPSLDVTKYVSFFPSDPEYEDDPRIMLENKEYCIGLSQSKALEACIFQTPVGLCGIHEISPRVCQIYPFKIHDGKDLLYKPELVCNRLVPTRDPEKVKVQIKIQRHEMQEYQAIADAWNAVLPHREGKKFLKFAGIYDYPDDPDNDEHDIRYDWATGTVVGVKN